MYFFGIFQCQSGFQKFSCQQPDWCTLVKLNEILRYWRKVGIKYDHMHFFLPIKNIFLTNKEKENILALKKMENLKHNVSVIDGAIMLIIS